MILIIPATACSKSKNEGTPLLNDINSIENYHEGAKEIVYTKDKDSEQIKEFMNAYNEAKPGDNSLGITHNIEGDKLWDYFKQLNIKFSK